MITWHHNGEYWYEQDRTIVQRIVRWLIWIGGWGAHSSQRMRRRLTWDHLAPISAFGHRVTFYGWGYQVKTPWGILVWSKRSGQIYISNDGTPNTAHIWIKGPPAEVKLSADNWKRERDRLRFQRERMARFGTIKVGERRAR